MQMLNYYNLWGYFQVQTQMRAVKDDDWPTIGLAISTGDLGNS